MNYLAVLAAAVAYLSGALGVSWSGAVVWLLFIALVVHLKNAEQVARAAESAVLWRQFSDVAPESERLWFNLLLQRWWLTYIAQPHVEEWVRGSLEAGLNGSKPAYVRAFHARAVHIGKKPPILERIQFIQAETEEDGERTVLTLEMDLKYYGEGRMLVDATMMKAGVVKLNLPIEVERFVLIGKIRVSLTLNPVPPGTVPDGYPHQNAANASPLSYYDGWFTDFKVGFLERPTLNYSIKFLKMVNLVDVPGLSKWLKTLLTEQVVDWYVLPNAYHLDYIKAYGTPEERIAKHGGLMPMRPWIVVGAAGVGAAALAAGAAAGAAGLVGAGAGAGASAEGVDYEPSDDQDGIDGGGVLVVQSGIDAAPGQLTQQQQQQQQYQQQQPASAAPAAGGSSAHDGEASGPPEKGGGGSSSGSGTPTAAIAGAAAAGAGAAAAAAAVVVVSSSGASPGSGGLALTSSGNGNGNGNGGGGSDATRTHSASSSVPAPGSDAASSDAETDDDKSVDMSGEDVEGAREGPGPLSRFLKSIIPRLGSDRSASVSANSGGSGGSGGGSGSGSGAGAGGDGPFETQLAQARVEVDSIERDDFEPLSQCFHLASILDPVGQANYTAVLQELEADIDNHATNIERRLKDVETRLDGLTKLYKRRGALQRLTQRDDGNEIKRLRGKAAALRKNTRKFFEGKFAEVFRRKDGAAAPAAAGAGAGAASAHS